MTANSNQGIRKNITIRHDFQYGDLEKLLMKEFIDFSRVKRQAIKVFVSGLWNI
ncbi:MAG: hypothetical protein GX240_05615 [Candidatus Atribacteria bacterium]|nr:hypothetical protein [Candidatus Atribacteria bacterium]